MSFRADIRRADGMTLVEVMVGMVIALITVLAISGTIVKGIDNSLGHQRQAALLTIAQREAESVRQQVGQFGFAALAMTGTTGAPAATLAGNPSNPDDFITGYGTASVAYRTQESFHDTTAGLATGVQSPSGDPLVIDAANGKVTPSTTSVTSGPVTATVYRYVTRRTDTCTTANACNGDSRRLIIAVVPTDNGVNAQLQTNKPVYLVTVINNPVPSDEPGKPGTGFRLGLNIG